MINILKKYWVSLIFLGALIGFSTQLLAIWEAPEKVQELDETVHEYIQEQRVYTAKREARNEKTDYLIELLTEKVIKDGD